MAQSVYLKLFFLNIFVFLGICSENRVERFILKMNQARTSFADIKEEYETFLSSLSATKKFGDIYIAQFPNKTVLLDIRSVDGHNFYHVVYENKKIKLYRPSNFRPEFENVVFDKIGKISRGSEGLVEIKMFDNEGRDLFVSHGLEVNHSNDDSPRSLVSLESGSSSHSNNTVVKNESIHYEPKPNVNYLEDCRNFDVVVHGFL